MVRRNQKRHRKGAAQGDFRDVNDVGRKSKSAKRVVKNNDRKAIEPL
jgi:hypothetical protein